MKLPLLTPHQWRHQRVAANEWSFAATFVSPLLTPEQKKKNWADAIDPTYIIKKKSQKLTSDNMSLFFYINYW
jgi:hypothetical protein